MANAQTLQSAPDGTIWGRSVGGVTYFLSKTNNIYEVWTSADSTHYRVSISDAVVYYNQHNLVNLNTARPPSAPTKSNPKKTVTSTTGTATRTTSTTTSPKKTVTSPEATTPVADNIPAGISTVIANEPVQVDMNNINAALDADVAAIPIPDFNTQVISIAAQQDSTQFNARSDWRVRLALTDDPSANYLYKSDKPGILAPLAETQGVLFPYTPQISVSYAATYDPASPVHSNYKVHQYTNSSVDNVTITCDFTAQDTYEANYLLAVIHFFRSMTKMFYGQDQNPKHGTPPPLCYLFGMGTFQFSAHPLAITGFTYNLPNDVDYIKTVAPYTPGTEQPSTGFLDAVRRLAGSDVGVGGVAKSPNFRGLSSNQTGQVTWVPTKIQLSISCLPMMSRNQVSNKFSLKEYASGTLLNGLNNPGGGGFW